MYSKHFTFIYPLTIYKDRQYVHAGDLRLHGTYCDVTARYYISQVFFIEKFTCREADITPVWIDCFKDMKKIEIRNAIDAHISGLIESNAIEMLEEERQDV